MWVFALYVALLLALFVRVRTEPVDHSPLVPPPTPAHLALVRWQHRIFYALLVAAPIEWWLRGRPAGWLGITGAVLFGLGIVAYRKAGGALGAQLSPLIAPREPARLIEMGLYRRLRHPMFLAEIAMACGAALTLEARISALLAIVFAAVVLRRIAVEEHALATRFPEYRAYAARTYRLIPYVY
jgi:protein-S-isoprenylcysteine O-methyltransferase Ste14